MSIKEKLMKITKPHEPQYKIVSVKELADFIFNMDIGEEVYFASDWDDSVPPENLNGSCCENWYGIKVVSAFDSVMAIFQYSGGGQAFATDVDGETIEEHILYYLRNFVNGTTVFHHVVLEY